MARKKRTVISVRERVQDFIKWIEDGEGSAEHRRLCEHMKEQRFLGSGSSGSPFCMIAAPRIHLGVGEGGAAWVFPAGSEGDLASLQWGVSRQLRESGWWWLGTGLGDW